MHTPSPPSNSFQKTNRAPEIRSHSPKCTFWMHLSQTSTILDPGDFQIDQDIHLNSAAHGSFVLALEDEFSSVRVAAIDSLRMLSLNSKPFCDKALESLIDMFNDEDSTVRRIAVQSVAQLTSRWNVVVSEDSLQFLYLVLRDHDRLVKTHAHQMLRRVWRTI
ncbi:Integrator complex subunit 4 [Kappamyces sp. JEL0680]|nr:Integrator complex subunit 4 [Kappamyces sp. JEL0680]